MPGFQTAYVFHFILMQEQNLTTYPYFLTSVHMPVIPLFEFFFCILDGAYPVFHWIESSSILGESCDRPATPLLRIADKCGTCHVTCTARPQPSLPVTTSLLPFFPSALVSKSTGPHRKWLLRGSVKQGNQKCK